jgi:carboxypeptidase C (cathepsin A)
MNAHCVGYVRYVFGMTVAVVWACGVQAEPRSFVTNHVAMIEGKRVPYVAAVEEYIVNDAKGTPAVSLFATSYVRERTADAAQRPVIFMFNGGPSAAATGVHMQFGPRQLDKTPLAEKQTDSPRFADNPNSLLDVADLVAFDPVESGYSRMLPRNDRAEFYSTEGDARALVQLVTQWLERHRRTGSPRYLLGESYGSIRQVVAAEMLANAGNPIDGQIILGNSIFLMETSRRTNNIMSAATGLPLFAITAAYHGKADRHGKSDAAFVDEVFDYAMAHYVPALAQGNRLGENERRQVAAELAAYTGIPASYYLSHELVIAKHDFNKMLLPGMALNQNDTRVVRPNTPSASDDGDWRASSERIYTAYLTGELRVALPGIDYRSMAPDSFDNWDWGSGCNDYLAAAGLCKKNSQQRSVFLDYDWPEVLKRQFSYPAFRTMVIASYYDGLSSIGSQLYLQAQLDYPKDRFELHAYPAGHATAADPAVQPRVLRDVKAFLARGAPRAQSAE